MNILFMMLVFLCGFSASSIAGEIISVPGDPVGKYEALSLEKPRESERVLTVKRSGSSGEVFTRIFIDCSSQTFRVINEGETFDEMNARKISDKRMINLVEGSGKYYQVQYACSK